MWNEMEPKKRQWFESARKVVRLSKLEGCINYGYLRFDVQNTIQ